jgi:hypothetical protein
VKVLGRDKKLWYLEALIIPVREGKHYGVYILGDAAGVEHFADIEVFFFPY